MMVFDNDQPEALGSVIVEKGDKLLMKADRQVVLSKHNGQPKAIYLGDRIVAANENGLFTEKITEFTKQTIKGKEESVPAVMTYKVNSLTGETENKEIAFTLRNEKLPDQTMDLVLNPETKQVKEAKTGKLRYILKEGEGLVPVDAAQSATGNLNLLQGASADMLGNALVAIGLRKSTAQSSTVSAPTASDINVKSDNNLQAFWNGLVSSTKRALNEDVFWVRNQAKDLAAENEANKAAIARIREQVAARHGVNDRAMVRPSNVGSSVETSAVDVNKAMVIAYDDATTVLWDQKKISDPVKFIGKMMVSLDGGVMTFKAKPDDFDADTTKEGWSVVRFAIAKNLEKISQEQIIAIMAQALQVRQDKLAAEIVGSFGQLWAEVHHAAVPEMAAPVSEEAAPVAAPAEPNFFIV
jgi:hypothetical protein